MTAMPDPAVSSGSGAPVPATERPELTARDMSLAALIATGEPVVLRGFAHDWPIVAAGRNGPEAAIAYLKRFDAGRPVVALAGDPAEGGRFHYNADLTGMNFTAARGGLSDYLDRLAARDSSAPSLYIGSTDLDQFLPGFRAENNLPPTEPVLCDHPPLASIWIGNRTTAPAHWDQSNNIAVCVVGRRRFTLFPPDQVANLYPGPLEPTPAGQVVSMVDFRAPDLARFPRFPDALAAARVAELEAGDAVVYPALWWHQVEALAGFNVMVNYWWNAAPAYLDTPMLTLMHGMISLRDRPADEKAAWRSLFDYYLFGDPELPARHLPRHARGPLAPLDPIAARRLRAQLLQRLNR